MNEKEKEVTENFINACNIEPVTLEISKKAGELYKNNRANGITLTTVDCIINATVIINGYKIATRNIKHYPNKEIVYSF